MAHSLILGQTESGKTTLAKRLSKILHESGEPVIVLDPLNDPGWFAGYKTSDPEQFLQAFWKSRGCHAFIDEAGDMVGRFDDTMRKTATRGRHWGHSCYYLSQRGAMVDTTVRAQCRHLFLFTSSIDDCKILAKEFNKPELLQAVDLPQGHYFHAARFQPLQRGKLW
jgi:energy-coupling factor transporter ATP-binding protein EcfA2